MARLRNDAANRLQLSGPLLSGYADGKVMVQNEPSTLLLPEKTPVVALFHLFRNLAKPTSIGYITRLDTVTAVIQVTTNTPRLDRESIQWRTNRFYIAAKFGKIANYFVTFSENKKPEEVTDDIKKIYARSY